MWIGFGLGVFWWIFESIVHVYFFKADSIFAEIFTTDSMELWMRSSIVIIFIAFGLYAHFTFKKFLEAQGQIKILSGLIPICANCKKIRDNEGAWNNIESFISSHSEADFTHGICPECDKKLYHGQVFV